VSLYYHKRNGILCAVSNLGPNREEITLRLNLTRFGLAGKELKATDTLNGHSMRIEKSRIKLSLSRLGWKLIWVKLS